MVWLWSGSWLFVEPNLLCNILWNSFSYGWLYQYPFNIMRSSFLVLLSLVFIFGPHFLLKWWQHSYKEPFYRTVFHHFCPNKKISHGCLQISLHLCSGLLCGCFLSRISSCISLESVKLSFIIQSNSTENQH